MNELLKPLIDMQRADSAMAKIHQRRKEIPQELDQLGKTFQEVEREMEAVRSRWKELQNTHKEKENTLKRGIENLQKSKNRLSDVKTNKEYQAILKELEVLEKKNGEAEEDIIKVLEELDSCRILLEESEKQYNSKKVSYERDCSLREREAASLEADLQQHIEEFQTVRAKIDPFFIKKYEAIKTIHPARAVVSIWKGICSGCHLNIPPQLYNELQKSGEVIQCPHCNRILYCEEPASVNEKGR